MSETFDSSALLTRCFRLFELVNPTEPEDVFIPKCLGKKKVLKISFLKTQQKKDFNLQNVTQYLFSLFS